MTPAAPGDWLDVVVAQGPDVLRKTRATATPWTLPPTVESSETEENEEDGSPDVLPTFPESAWRGVFGLYRETMRGATEAPEVTHFAAMQVLAAVRLRRRVSFDYPYPHFPNVYVVIVGPTGDTKKTTSMRLALPLLSSEDRVKLCQGAGSTEALGDWMMQGEDEPPVSHLLVLEELATLLARGKWDGSTVIQFLTQTYDCPPVYELKYRKNPIKVVEPTPSLYAGTTVEWLWRSLAEEDIYGGFGNRIAFFVGQPQAPIPLPTMPDPGRLEPVRAALTGLDAIHVGQCRMTAEAKELFSRFYRAWKTTPYDALVRAMTRRAPAFAVKLALVYAALERTAPDILADQVGAALEVAMFQIDCAKWLVAQRQATTSQAGASPIRQASSAPSTRGLADSPSDRGRRFAAERWRALSALYSTGAIVPCATGKYGAPIFMLYTAEGSA
jgi:hypothetical protein